MIIISREREWLLGISANALKHRILGSYSESINVSV